MGLAKRCLLLGLIVPVEEAEEAEEADDESSSCPDSGNGWRLSISSPSSSSRSSSERAFGGSGGSKGKPAASLLQMTSEARSYYDHFPKLSASITRRI